jgi:hypothetical protein
MSFSIPAEEQDIMPGYGTTMRAASVGRVVGPNMLTNFAMATSFSLLEAAFLGLILTASACGRDLNSAQGVAEEFVDQHYVVIDLPKAKTLAVSVALSKLNEEIRLTSGQPIDASTRKPRVHYTLLEKKEGDQRATFLYEGTIQSDDNTSFTRQWLITARREGTQWRVSNFTESD